LARALDQHSGRVAAVVACRAFGTPAAAEILAAWSAAAAQHDVPLVVDAAAGIGTGSGGPPPGAEIGSMHPTQPLPVGEGGLVVLRDAGVADAVRVLINHGMDADHLPVTVGLNGKLDEWHAATALVGLGRLDEAIAARRAVSAAMR